MEEGPDGEATTDVKFIASHAEIFPSGEVVVEPDSHCSLVAVSPKYGLVFVACGAIIKVFTTKSLTEGTSEKVALTTINTGAQITHVAASCDGLTLLVIILHNDVPHALFYEVRNIVPGCAEQRPFVSVGVSSSGGGRVHGLAWSPVDSSSVALAVSPASLVMIILREAKVEVKTENIPARAVGWSPKGKQLTVGLSDGSLRLFKPDLTAVRTVPRPPDDGIGSVLSITWFTSTEFFISYKIVSEEESHVMMYVNAPKAKDPRFVTYDYLCNDNQGPRPHMLYPAYFPEWSLLCVLSSRATQVGVLGRSQAGESWCEYEIEEGGCAVLHTVAHNEETFPLGLAVDFTSQKIFKLKDESTYGPFPVLYTLSTGGELNIFHLVNVRPSVEQQLAKPADVLPLSGHRSAQQFNGASSYAVPRPGGLPVLSPFPAVRFPSSTSSTTGITSLSSSIPVAAAVAPTAAASTATGPLSGATFSSLPAAAGLFKSSIAEPQQGATTPGLPLPSLVKPNTSAETANPSFSFNLPTSSPFTAAATPVSNTSSGSVGSSSSLFTGLKGIAPTLSPFVASPHTQPAAFSSSSLPTFSGGGTGIQQPTPLGDAKFQVNMTSSTTTTDNAKSQGLKIPAFQLPNANTSSGSISQGKPALNPITSTAFKTTSHLTPPVSQDKQIDTQGSSGKSQSPALAGKPSLSSLTSSDSSLLSTIASVTSQFDEELRDHVHSSGFSSKIANKEEMGDVRRSLSEVCEWTELMDRTSSELKSEVSQLHSEVLEGYTLAEEAKVHMTKNKNPRNRVPLSRPLDPHSRRQLVEIRSLYQYLQSQLVEVETKLHLDWAAFTNDRSKKKKHELPASETMYQALKKCNNLRRVCERSVDAVCDRIKALNLNFLSSLSGTRCHYDEDEALASLEKSLRETSITPKLSCSPFKMLSPGKQEKLEKILSQRQVIPLRKCSSAPKADLTYVDNLFSVCSRNGSPGSGSPTTHQSFSFGPQTFSTPRVDSVASIKASAAIDSGDPTAQYDTTPRSWETSGSCTFVMPELAGSENYNQSPAATPTSFAAAKSHGTDLQIPKPQYEDITPPQTPDNNKLESGLKTASPLLALSSLVSKVPTTTTADVMVSNGASLTASKPALVGEPSTNTIPVGGGIKAQIVTSVPAAQTNFTFKPVTSVPSLPSVVSIESSSVPFSFTPFVPQSSFSFGDGKSINFSNPSNGQQSQGITSGVMFKAPPPSSAATVTLVSDGNLKSQSGVSSEFSFKTPVSLSLGSSFSVSDNVIHQTEEVCEELVVTESDTASSSSGESDTASNNTVVVDSVSYSGASDSADGQEMCPANTENNKDFNQGPLINALGKENENRMSSFSSTGSSLSTSTSTFSSSALSGSSIFGSGKLGSVSEAVTTSTGTNIFSGIKSTFSLSSTGSLFGPSSMGAFSTGTGTAGSSVFGTPPATSAAAGNIFGTLSSTSTTGSIFASIPITTAAGTVSGAPTTSMTESIFDKSVSIATTAGSMFRAAVTTNTITTSASSGSILNSTASTTTTTAAANTIVSTGVSTTSTTTGIGLFGSTSGNLFAVPTPSSSSVPGTTTATSEGFFGSKTTATGSLFGIKTSTNSSTFAATTPKSTSIFGNVAASDASDLGGTSTGTSKSIFGGLSNSSGSIFSEKPTVSGNNSLGAASNSESTSSSVTSATRAAVVTSSSAFSVSFSTGTGSVSSCTQPTSSIFGGTVPAAGSSSGLFNTTTTTTTTFGQPSTFAALTTSSSGSAFSSLSSSSSGVFGTSTTTTTTSGVIPAFGQTVSQSSSSVFTQGSQSTQASLFATAAPATVASIFGNSGQQSGSVFSGAAGQGGSVFGNQASTTGGIFGGSSSSSSSQPSTASVFGTPAGGGGGSGFNSSSTTGGSVFGQTSTAAASPFSASSSTTQQESPFGSSGFGSGGGGFFGGLGGKPSTENASKNVFGGTATVDTKPQNILFGNTNNNAFGSSSGFGGSGSGSNNSTFSTGGGSVSQSGFAVPSPQNSSGFGGGATFGGPPALGTSPAFGGGPTFGSPNKLGSSTFGGNPTFSSPLAGSPGGGGFCTFGASGGSTFGSLGGSPAPAASSSSTSPGFSSFANQENTASFGGLAQQSTNAQSSAFGSGGNVFGGGSSFSSWR